MSLIWDRSTGKPERKLREEFLAHENISMGGEKVPIAEHDEGLRYLGYWIDACPDWLGLGLGWFRKTTCRQRRPPGPTP